MRSFNERFTAKRAIASLICVSLIALVIFSGIFIAHASTHVCSHNDCPVCAGIRQCVENLRLLGMGRIVYCVALLIMILSVAILPRMTNAYAEATLFAQHVRLNN